MNEQTIITAIASVGFPIVVAWYLLTRMSKVLDANTKAVLAIKEAFEKLCEKIDGKTI